MTAATEKQVAYLNDLVAAADHYRWLIDRCTAAYSDFAWTFVLGRLKSEIASGLTVERASALLDATNSANPITGGSLTLSVRKLIQVLGITRDEMAAAWADHPSNATA